MAQMQTVDAQARRSDNVRIGPISVITLIIVICMAVLAVLAASTSYASTTISARQATATQMMYLGEQAGQEFVASVDETLSGVRASGGSAAAGARAVDAALDSICEDARAVGQGDIMCTASVNGTTVSAKFVCGNSRQLDIAITIRDDATFSVKEWKMTSVQQATPSTGTLWSGV